MFRRKSPRKIRKISSWFSVFLLCEGCPFLPWFYVTLRYLFSPIGPADFFHPSSTPHFETFKLFVICCPKRPSLRTTQSIAPNVTFYNQDSTNHRASHNSLICFTCISFEKPSVKTIKLIGTFHPLLFAQIKFHQLVLFWFYDKLKHLQVRVWKLIPLQARCGPECL